MPTAIQSNLPQGGFAGQQPVTPSGQLTPTDIQAVVEALTPIQARFRQMSTFLNSQLDQASFTLTAPTQNVNGDSVGLAVMLKTEWNVTITVANGATVAQTFVPSEWFPYCLIANTTVSINGGAATFSASGIATLITMLRQRRGTRHLDTMGGFGPALDPSLLQITLGSNLTATNAAAGNTFVSGIKSVSVAASASTLNTIKCTFYTFERLVLDIDSLLGALPLQNQSTSVKINRRIQSSLSGTQDDVNICFNTAGANLTFTLTTCTADTEYWFASVPGDPSLYSAMVRNAFELIEEPNNTTASTGAQALKYAIPQNKYIVALHVFGRDTNGAMLKAFDKTNGLGQMLLQYNAGTVTPVKRNAGTQRASGYLSYGDDLNNFPGWRMYDGEDTSDSITESDNMGWLDTYSTATSRLFFDVGSSASPTLTWSALREAVVSGAVTQVGG